ncbi:cyclopropane-fatty-acyl-phospholipid synthase [Halocynthiibacter sp. C4]|uniref:SAM-dependent methyltransferase n=1 Tax=Halocynthiibacter sp. C4 TaxID=2992758 RepID=UPI00237A867F|nr:cyclopropane-fatty-acyl-phospholipid synthase family protein [Halocynthiibacter sp. C4]MDE0591532.1 cyclopropane-fatty-acyl-phospholipid synthase [Halocynthiibacter sp. C4]
MLFLSNRVKRDFLETCATIREGSLRIRTPEGDVHDFGAGEPFAEMEIHDWSVVSATAARGDIGLGETYVAGLWDSPSVKNVLMVAIRNMHEFRRYAYANFWNTLGFKLLDRVLRANSKRGASRNIRAHYDVGNDFYELWLDPSMTYSSALFTEGDDDLFRAQHRKYDRILGKLSDGERILEVGCGWGGFAERAAGDGRFVTGLTISPSQKKYADERLGKSADIKLLDYRNSEGTYDNIVSIEMIEAVGEHYWPTYFSTLKARLAEGGRAMIQAITVPDSYFPIYKSGSDFIRHYTFPGGMLLSEANIREQAKKAGLVVNESHGFGLDYAKTCGIWAERLMEKAEDVMALGHDRAFLRTWLYYLEICSASFQVGHTNVTQVELAHAK